AARNSAKSVSLHSNMSDSQTPEDQSIKKTDPPSVKEPESIYAKKEKRLAPADLVRQVVLYAKKGQVMESRFTVGQTSFNEVEKNWGKPDELSKTKAGVYASYNSRNEKVGFKKGKPTVFDVRYDANKIRTIRLSDIQQVMGKADELHFYKDSHVNQEIFIYNLGGRYLLKWVMDKPTSTHPNPHVDHISIVALIREATILNKMTLDEKIGQMLLIGIKGKQAGTFAKNAIQNEHVGGVILFSRNIDHSNQTLRLINQLKTCNRAAGNPWPLLISADQEGGSVQRLPAAIHPLPSNGKIGRANDPKFSYEVGQAIGEEMNAFGFNMDFAPVLDINVHGTDSVIGDRSFGANKDVVSRLGIATMHGIQSQHVISVVKHFPGYGAVQVDAHEELPKVNETMDDLINVEWYPYKKAIANGADTVMVTHMVIPSLDPEYPASMSRPIITGMLREKLGFNGVVVTDDLTMAAIENHYDVTKAAIQSVKAGADIVMIAFKEDQQASVFHALKKAVQDGEIPISRINESVSRIIRLKEKYHLSDHKHKKVDVNKLNHDIEAVLSKKFS
ncbi:MAG TPA: beta-N-acetylhexosaminidase, partial [Bacillales bacterium]|nr:beta-N-acetylhexosaminidase [Bacillales bacterium]